MLVLDYSRIAYPIEGIPDDEQVIEKFPDLLSKADVFCRDDVPEGVDTDKVLRYLIYMYAPGTPLDEIPDIPARKNYVLKKLGIMEGDDEDVLSGYGEMCAINKPWIVERFITFTSFHCSIDYGIMHTAMIRVQTIQKALLTAEIDKSTDDSNYQKGLEGWRVKYEEARERITKGEQSVILQRAMNFMISAKTLGISPEEFSRVWREKKEIFPEVIP